MREPVKIINIEFLPIVAVSIGISVALSVVITVGEISITFFLSLMYFFIVVFLVFENYKKKRLIEFFNPVIFYALLWTIPFAIIPLMIFFGMEPSSILWTSHMFTWYIPHSQIAAILGILFLYLGFKNKLRLFHIRWWNNPMPKDTWRPIYVYLAVFFLLILSALFITDMLGKGTFFFGVTEFLLEKEPTSISYLCALFGISRGTPLYLFGSLLIAMIGYARSKSFSIKVLFVFLFIFNILISLISTQKEILVSAIFVLMYYFYYLKNNFKSTMSLKKESLFAIVVLLFFLLLPFLNAYRIAISLSSSPGSLLEILKKFETANDLTDFARDYGSILIRFDHLNTHLSIIAQTPSIIEYKFGTTYLNGIMAFFQGFPMMPKEGAFEFNNLFARQYGIITPYDIYTAVTLPQISEIYMNFGFLAIPVIMFFYGIFFRNIYDILTMNRNANVILIGFILWYLFVFQHTALAFSSVMFHAGRILLGLLTVIFLLNLNKFLRYVAKRDF